MQHLFTVTVEAETAALAEQVIAERLGHDEDYGFPYRLDWQQAEPPTAPAEPALAAADATARAETLRDLAANADDEVEYHELLAQAARLEAGSEDAASVAAASGQRTGDG